jgi:hypothetical protein
VVWPEVPAPFYFYDEDPRFRKYATGWRATRAYLLTGVVAHTPPARRSIRRTALALGTAASADTTR